MKSAKSVEEFIENYPEWKSMLTTLRNFLLESGMTETIKWGAPVYTVNGKNVAGIGAFKSYAGIWFFQGALLEDKYQLLINANESNTKALRQMRFHHESEIEEVIVRGYITEAINNQMEGREIKPDKAKPLEIPGALQEMLNENPELKQRFEQSNLTRKREFAELISTAKREDTLKNRLEKIKIHLQENTGLNDKYRP